MEGDAVVWSASPSSRVPLVQPRNPGTGELGNVPRPPRPPLELRNSGTPEKFPSSLTAFPDSRIFGIRELRNVPEFPAGGDLGTRDGNSGTCRSSGVPAGIPGFGNSGTPESSRIPGITELGDSLKEFGKVPKFSNSQVRRRGVGGGHFFFQNKLIYDF